MKKVSSNQLQERLETVKTLSDGELELYEIAKDRDTGDHYLHYSYLHRDIAAGGQEEVFHQLLPLENDDVLGIMFSDQPYTYPDHWKRAFLRNGPEGDYVWFDPGYLDDERESAEVGKQLKEMLLKFKTQGAVDENAVRKLLEDADRLRDPE